MDPKRTAQRQNALAEEWAVMATWVTEPFVNKNGPLEGKIDPGRAGDQLLPGREALCPLCSFADDSQQGPVIVLPGGSAQKGLQSAGIVASRTCGQPA